MLRDTFMLDNGFHRRVLTVIDRIRLQYITRVCHTHTHTHTRVPSIHFLLLSHSNLISSNNNNNNNNKNRSKRKGREQVRDKVERKTRRNGCGSEVSPLGAFVPGVSHESDVIHIFVVSYKSSPNSRSVLFSIYSFFIFFLSLFFSLCQYEPSQ